MGWRELGESLVRGDRASALDAGTGPAWDAAAVPCGRSPLMIRNSYLALCRAMEAPVRPSAVALRVPLPPPVRRDPQRGLSGADEHDRARVLVGREPVDPGDHAMKTPTNPNTTTAPFAPSCCFRGSRSPG